MLLCSFNLSTADPMTQVHKGIYTLTPLHLSGNLAEECIFGLQMVGGVNEVVRLREMTITHLCAFCEALGMYYVNESPYK